MYARRAWTDAYESLARADHAAPLEAGDLELLARSGYMLGRDDVYRRGLERAYRWYVDEGDLPGAARCAWWLGHNCLFRGEAAPARGWTAALAYVDSTLGDSSVNTSYEVDAGQAFADRPLGLPARAAIPA